MEALPLLAPVQQTSCRNPHLGRRTPRAAPTPRTTDSAGTPSRGSGGACGARRRSPLDVRVVRKAQRRKDLDRKLRQTPLDRRPGDGKQIRTPRRELRRDSMKHASPGAGFDRRRCNRQSAMRGVRICHLVASSGGWGLCAEWGPANPDGGGESGHDAGFVSLGPMEATPLLQYH